MFGGFAKKSRLLRCRDISDKDCKNPPGICKCEFSIHFEISFTAVTNKKKFSLGKVTHYLLEGALLSLRNWLKNALQHTTVGLQVN